ncbi:MAG: 2-dehydropantoate 2-reductase [Thermoplasmata archaeon]
MRHAVLGAGGVGGLLGACLSHTGDSVTLVVRPETVAQTPRILRLKSPFGDFQTDVAIAAEVPPADVLWIAVKATQLEAAITALRRPQDVSAIVPVLNGVDHVAMLRTRYPSDQVIPATIGVESERVGPGHIVHRSPFARLSVSSVGRSALSSTLDHLQRLGFKCQFVDDEPTLMWGKLVFLAPVALTTSAADRPIGGIVSDPVWKAQLESCVREACAVALAEGAKVDPATVLASAVGMPPGLRSSMQKDVEQHRPPELDAIAGPILRGARRHNIPAPTTQQLVEAVAKRVQG